MVGIFVMFPQHIREVVMKLAHKCEKNVLKWWDYTRCSSNSLQIGGSHKVFFFFKKNIDIMTNTHEKIKKAAQFLKFARKCENMS